MVVEVDVASVDTDNKDRDDHLHTADFFEVERWPLAKVRVHSAERIEGVRYRAKFDVSIRDAQKTIDGEFEIVSEDPLSVKGSLVIDRMDFGIGTPKTRSPMSITNEVPVTFEASLAPSVNLRAEPAFHHRPSGWPRREWVEARVHKRL